ncbi:MAG: DNA translocase FtsK 4TM domain-containing protein, partial [Pseudomonadota bacterium]|nr:DNA translocase FtsK 4TM domain-containing protein [Pseudomonadota bacterium]
MASRTTAAVRPALLPPAAVAFMRRRFVEFSGGVLGIAAVLFGLALASYGAGDPSLNTATGQAAANLVGYAGAIAADLALQSVGLAAVALVIAPLAWAWRIASHHGLSRPWLRLAMLPLCLVALAAGCATLPHPDGWTLVSGLGGVAGVVIVDAMVALIAPVGGSGIHVAILGFTLATLTLAPATGLSLAEWRGLGANTWRLTMLPLRLAAGAVIRRRDCDSDVLLPTNRERQEPSLRRRRDAPVDNNERREPALKRDGP